MFGGLFKGQQNGPLISACRFPAHHRGMQPGLLGGLEGGSEGAAEFDALFSRITADSYWCCGASDGLPLEWRKFDYELPRPLAGEPLGMGGGGGV